MSPFVCPTCGADRPAEPHLDWCDYDGPDFGPGEHEDEES